jgi:CxxC motif-containing protein (DUF1111 family)
MRQSIGTSGGAWNLGTSGGNKRGGFIRWGSFMFASFIAASLSPADEPVDEEPPTAEQITAGHELFVREWQVDDRRAVGGDGLGPLYNAASCVKCHGLGGIGGAGANDSNVDLLTLKVPRNITVATDDLRQQVAAFHPALAIAQPVSAFRPVSVIGQLSATTVLHRYSADPNYDAWRRRFLSASRQSRFPLDRIVAFTTGVNKRPLKGMNPVQRLNGMAYQHSERNTPALFGAGLIDRLPDSVLEEIQQQQAAKKGGVSGRVPRASTGKVGRFGWRGQTENLHEFVLGACAVELGLEAPGRHQPIDPLRVRIDRPLVVDRHDLDISDEQCKSLTQFVALLPPPGQVLPDDAAKAAAVARGERHFHKIGCADCHVKQVADISGIYSDLLLHDLGEGLEDPVPAISGSAGSYYGGADSLLAKVTPEQRREWRTPPLWGVRDSAPYLHDGRARTFVEAIAWHGGEAAGSARDFQRLEKDEQEDIVAFLNCLTAPAPDSLALENIVLVAGR